MSYCEPYSYPGGVDRPFLSFDGLVWMDESGWCPVSVVLLYILYLSPIDSQFNKHILQVYIQCLSGY